MLGLITIFALGLTLTPAPGPSDLLPNEEGFLGVLGTHSAKPLKPGALILGGADRVLMGLSIVNGGKSVLPGQNFKLEDCLVNSENNFLSLGLGYGFDVALEIPMYYEYTPGFPDHTEILDAGDIAFLIKSKLPMNVRFTSLAILTELSAPTSSSRGVLPKKVGYIPANDLFPNESVHPMGLNVPRLGAGGAITVDLSELTDGNEALLHLNILANRSLASSKEDPLGTMRIALAAEIAPTRSFRLEAELRHETLLAQVTELFHPRAQTVTLSLGLGMAVGRSFSLQGGIVMAPPAWNSLETITVVSPSGEGRLQYRIYPTASVFLGMAWQGFPMRRDTDRDGVPDSKDNCPTIPEDQDGFQDTDGCPDGDNDGDGIPDELDQCPYATEDFDGFEDRDGCPDVDNDRDGILEGRDACPNDAEDKDGFQDSDGCPELDNDQDGITDLQDKCPMQPENKNGIDDADGCPEQDTDGDGIQDMLDKCPNEKEIINFYQDEDGCPDERPEAIRDGVLQGIDFMPGTADLLATSDTILVHLAFKLKAFLGTEIEIQAHLDDRAGPRAKELTEARAEAVADALNKLGIDLRRMKRTGYGYSRPLVPNRTAKGRAANRRIEIKRLN